MSRDELAEKIALLGAEVRKEFPEVAAILYALGGAIHMKAEAEMRKEVVLFVERQLSLISTVKNSRKASNN